MNISVKINGRETALAPKISVENYLTDANIKQQYVAVALNGVLVKREIFAETVLQNGDKLDIVRPAGGG